MRLGVGIYACLLVVSCSSQPTVRFVDLSPPISATAAIPEHLLLNVGVKVLDPNIPKSFDRRNELNISEEIRRAESNYIAHFAKNLLQSTGNWGAVRVIPRDSYAVDVAISGTILHSDGERLIAQIKVQDARGIIWIDDVYETLASKFAYDSNIPDVIDPFQTMYKDIADEMYYYQRNLSPQEIEEIRTIAELRFAREFSPDAFGEHVVQSEDDVLHIARLPNEDDQMLQRVRQIREREYLFIDTLDEYYGDFADRMYPAYQNWRESSYGDAIALREERERAKLKMVAGGAMIVGGAAMQRSSNTLTEYAGYASVIGGAGEAIGGILARANATIHASALREMGESAAAEISPYTIELENTTISLMGTVDEQYTELRKILRRLFYEDYDLEVPTELTETEAEQSLEAEIFGSTDTSE